ncbi:hypothetical protein [Zunongwangia profunda]|jgi:hypothetical protein|uniref:hypothetical protein n=1 Tax=Zunongwangia profunda TaxID=398743 RepID=UPI001D18EFAF|nr:hypothetical protein [Zunongwangia profunda]MCC4228582.1 hypothetical protein [Zunongwangia profunda]
MKNLKNIIMDLEIISKTTLFCEMGVLVLLSWSIGFPKKKRSGLLNPGKLLIFGSRG